MVPSQTAIPGFVIRVAEVADVPLVLSFIRELAEYERLSNAVVATEQTLTESLFGSRPSAEVVLGFLDERPVSFAIFFHNFSSFLGKPGLYLEDIYVKPEVRGKGLGKEMLSFLARIAVERGCGRMEWSVLDWNEPAIEFYKKLGAVPMDEWTVFRLTGENLKQLGQDSK